MPTLRIVTGDRAGEEISLEQKRFVIGRSESAGLRLDADAVSGEHCALLLRGDRYALQDLNSTNGTRLNGSPIREARLKAGDRIQVGDVELLFEDPTAESEARPATAKFEARRNRKWTAVLLWLLGAVAIVAAAGWFIFRLLNV